MMLCVILYVAPKAFKVRGGPWGSGLDIFKKRHIIFTQDLHQWKVPFLSCLIRHKEILAPKTMEAAHWRKQTRTGRLG